MSHGMKSTQLAPVFRNGDWYGYAEACKAAPERAK
jgi:hypothetical protein